MAFRVTLLKASATRSKTWAVATTHFSRHHEVSSMLRPIRRVELQQHMLGAHWRAKRLPNDLRNIKRSEFKWIKCVKHDENDARSVRFRAKRGWNARLPAPPGYKHRPLGPQRASSLGAAGPNAPEHRAGCRAERLDAGDPTQRLPPPACSGTSFYHLLVIVWL